VSSRMPEQFSTAGHYKPARMTSAYSRCGHTAGLIAFARACGCVVIQAVKYASGMTTKEPSLDTIYLKRGKTRGKIKPWTELDLTKTGICSGGV
jgi:hypothetical protein